MSNAQDRTTTEIVATVSVTVRRALKTGVRTNVITHKASNDVPSTDLPPWVDAAEVESDPTITDVTWSGGRVGLDFIPELGDLIISLSNGQRFLAHVTELPREHGLIECSCDMCDDAREDEARAELAAGA